MAYPVDVGRQTQFLVEGRSGPPEASRPASFTGIPEWSVQPELLTLRPSRDGLSCVGTGLAPGGECVVTCRVGSLVGTFAVSVLPSAATALAISAQDVPAVRLP